MFSLLSEGSDAQIRSLEFPQSFEKVNVRNLAPLELQLHTYSNLSLKHSLRPHVPHVKSQKALIWPQRTACLRTTELNADPCFLTFAR